jgi:hypothetical protein
VTSASQNAKTKVWSPAFTGTGVGGIIVFAAWSSVQPLIHGLSRTPLWSESVIWFLGLVALIGIGLRVRYRRAAPFRATLAEARAARPGSVVYGVQLDPIATPVGVEWADSRAITWGLIIASPELLEIVKSDGSQLLKQPWTAVKFSWVVRTRLFVTVDRHTEEWWVPLISESGAWPMGVTRRPVERRLLEMLAVGGIEASEGLLSV